MTAVFDEVCFENSCAGNFNKDDKKTTDLPKTEENIAIVDTVIHMRWKTLEYPSYSPDLTPCNFHVFSPLKRTLNGRRFISDTEMIQDVRYFFVH